MRQVVAAYKIGIEKPVLENLYTRVKVRCAHRGAAAEPAATQENPFNSIRKMVSMLVDTAPAVAANKSLACFRGSRYCGELQQQQQVTGGSIHMPERRHTIGVVTGAPSVLLQQCTRVSSHVHRTRSSAHPTQMWVDDVPAPDCFAPLERRNLDEINAVVDDLASQAFRVLAIGCKPFPGEERPDDSSENLESDVVFLGLIASIDPERPEVIPAIEKARAAGIRTVMITGGGFARAFAGCGCRAAETASAPAQTT
jgi:magnesium-transporting ATPase (P-type)